MRKKVLVILYITLCMTMTLPVYAKKGGGKGKPTVTMTGAIDYFGKADVRDTRTKIVVRVYAKNPVPTMTLKGWPDLDDGTRVDGEYTQFEFEFYVHKSDGVLGAVNFVFAWDDYVMNALGYATSEVEGFTVTITEGSVIQRGHGNQPTVDVGSFSEAEIIFSVLY